MFEGHHCNLRCMHLVSVQKTFPIILHHKFLSSINWLNMNASRFIDKWGVAGSRMICYQNMSASLVIAFKDNLLQTSYFLWHDLFFGILGITTV
jgi:hypothetical protein